MSSPAAEGLPLWLRARRVLGRVRRAFSVDTFDVFARPVLDADESFKAPADYAFRWAGGADVAGCDAYHTELDERERREGVARIELGHRAVVALAGDDVVFSMWVNPRNANVPGCIKRRLSPDQVFIYKAFTSPEHRGRKLYEAGMRFVLADLARRGMRELVGYAHLKKRISRKGLAALKFESRGRFYAVRAPGWQHTFVSRRLASHFPQATPRSQAISSAELASDQP